MLFEQRPERKRAISDVRNLKVAPNVLLKHYQRSCGKTEGPPLTVSGSNFKFSVYLIADFEFNPQYSVS